MLEVGSPMINDGITASGREREQAILAKPPKAVDGWFTAASDVQLRGATMMVSLRPEESFGSWPQADP